MSEPAFLSTKASGHGRGWYRGDCHVHSVYSDGALTPEQLADAARAAALDFVATTEHNTADAHGAWAQVAEDLVVILGEEATTQTGHWLALGLQPGELVDWRYGVRDEIVDRQLDRVHQADGLCVAAHPFAPFAGGTFMYPYDGFDVVEVWNGEWTSDRAWQADNDAALSEWARSLASDIHRGTWRPAMGNSDTHLDHQIGLPHTVVLADELSVGAILAGLRAGRSWIAGSTDIDLSLTASAGDRRAGIGEQLKTRSEPAVVHVDIRGVPAGTVSVKTEQGTVHRCTLPDTGSGTVELRTSAAEAGYVRTEIRHPDGTMAALTNPIVLT